MSVRTRLAITLGVGFLAAVGAAPGEEAAGIRWTAPAGWETAPPRPMRAATYVIPAADEDDEAGECGVFFFGPGQGGGVEANVDRWVSQFRAADGSGGLDVKRASETIGGLPVTTLDLSGIFLWRSRPSSPDVVEKPGYRLLGAIVEAPEGAVFFKLTAPAATAAAAEPAFGDLLQSIAKTD